MRLHDPNDSRGPTEAPALENDPSSFEQELIAAAERAGLGVYEVDAEVPESMTRAELAELAVFHAIRQLGEVLLTDPGLESLGNGATEKRALRVVFCSSANPSVVSEAVPGEVRERAARRLLRRTEDGIRPDLADVDAIVC